MTRQFKLTTLAAFLGGVALPGTAGAEVLPNNGDSWVRENDPDATFAGDLISVWNSTAGDRRYGVISFDLTSLSEPVTDVSLSLWSEAFGFSDDPIPVKQGAIAVDPAGIDADFCTWNELAAADTLHTFEQLGALDVGAPGTDSSLDGVMIESVGSAADAAFVESVRTGSGTLVVVLIAEEDAADYKGTWGDGEYAGQDAVLNTNGDVSPPGDDPNLDAPSELAFGQVTQGQGPFVLSLPIENTGSENTLTVSAATLTGPHAAQFTVADGAFPLDIGPGESAGIEVSFDPGSGPGDFAATLELASNDPSDAVLAVALTATSTPPRITVPNSGDSWVRENAPETPYSGDLVSVWNGTGGDRRYGLISFDLSSLTEPVGGVTLALWSEVFGFSDDGLPVKQSAVAIDPAGIDPDAATWSQVEAAAVLHTFEGLGALDVDGPGTDPDLDGVFIETEGTAADAAFVESVRSAGGTLMVVLVAAEDATDYKGSWGDGEYAGEDSFLAVEPAGLRPQFVIDYDSGSNELQIAWESKLGLLYTLRSDTDLSLNPEGWPVFGGFEDLPAGPSGTNTVSFPLPVDPERFFVIEQAPAPPITVFEEDFDDVVAPSLPAGWTSGADPVADTGTTIWELGSPSAVGPAVANSTPNCVGTNLAGEYGFDTDIWLRTPPIDLAGVAQATLHFNQFVDIEIEYDLGRVAVLDASDDSELAVVTDMINGFSGGWVAFSQPLPASVLGGDIKIEFRFQADDVGNFPGWYLDDVVVTVP